MKTFTGWVVTQDDEAVSRMTARDFVVEVFSRRVDAVASTAEWVIVGHRPKVVRVTVSEKGRAR